MTSGGCLRRKFLLLFELMSQLTTKTSNLFDIYLITFGCIRFFVFEFVVFRGCDHRPNQQDEPTDEDDSLDEGFHVYWFPCFALLELVSRMCPLKGGFRYRGSAKIILSEKCITLSLGVTSPWSVCWSFQERAVERVPWSL